MKLLADVLKYFKSSTTMKKRIKNPIVMEEENIEVVEFRENENIDPDVAAEMEKRRKEFYI